MIDKKLINFKKEADFLTQKEAGNIKDTSVVFIDDVKKIVTHGTEFDCSGDNTDLTGYAKESYVTEQINSSIGDIDKILDKINGEVI